MPTIAQAQSLFLSSGGLDSLGMGKKSAYQIVTPSGSKQAVFNNTSMNAGTMEAMLSLYISEFLDTASENLRKVSAVTTGNLEKSLDFEVTQTANGYRIDFKALEYFKFVDKGVRGAGASRKNNTSPYKFKFINPSKNHVTAIEKWIIRNRIQARAKDVRKYGKTGLEKKAIDPTKGRQSLAYIIAKSIKRDGLYETGFWSDAFDDVFKDFGAQMSKALGQSITVSLEQMKEDLANFKGSGQGRGVNIPRI